MCYSQRRPNGQEGFVPVNYVKEVEPAVIRNITKKKVTKPVTVTVKILNKGAVCLENIH